MSTEPPEFTGALDRGLEGVVACTTSISAISGSTLLYRGYPIQELAEHSSFEEVIFLLWMGTLPAKSDLESFSSRLHRIMPFPLEAAPWLYALPQRVHPMDFLHAVLAALSLQDPDANLIEAGSNLRKAERITARMGTIIAAYHRVRNNSWPLQPRRDRSIAWNFLYMLHGAEPDEERVRQLDVCLILHADHELNASAFSARVTASTLSGLYSSVMSAIGTLKGPLHGGANEQVMKMLLEIGQPAEVDRWLDRAFSLKQKVMGFGHRVYKGDDPRAMILRGMSEQLCRDTGRAELFEISAMIDERMRKEKGLLPNVDFYSATVYYALGIPPDLFTPLFAASRVSGWCAHVLEQYASNRIYRPRGRYAGPESRPYPTLAKRRQ